MKETNMEHFRGEIEEKNYSFGRREDDFISCVAINCARCDFGAQNNWDDEMCGCASRRIKWLMSEYKPELVLTEKEIRFVEFVQRGWLARDADGDLFWHGGKPEKCSNSWHNFEMKYSKVNSYDGEIFRFITWEDEEPWSVADLRKLKALEYNPEDVAFKKGGVSNETD